jgi:hypothetical protein
MELSGRFDREMVVWRVISLGGSHWAPAFRARMPAFRQAARRKNARNARRRLCAIAHGRSGVAMTGAIRAFDRRAIGCGPRVALRDAKPWTPACGP